MNLSLLGVPLDLGAQNLGVDIGPDAFRYEKLVEKLENSGFKINDLGNVKCNPRKELTVGNKNIKYLEEIVRVSEESAKIVDQIVAKGEKVVAIGGDHSINLGVVSGASTALKGDLGIIYLDAHGDMNTDKSTLTGNIHGMHLASLMGFGHPKLINVYKEGTKINKTNLVHIGGNDFDQAELDLINSEGLISFKIFDLLSNGLRPLFAMIDDLSKRVNNIWISMDLDVIDSVYAPGAGMPNKAGLNYREITTIADYIGKNCHVIGMDVVEYNPLQDIDGKTAELGIELIAKFFGHNYSWYTNYLNKNQIS